MGTIIDITQREIDHALATKEVAAKIKLRRLSQANLIEHVKNIPYMAVRGPQMKLTKFHLPLEQQLNISPKKYIQLLSGSYRPINVKEDKVNNINRHADTLISDSMEKEEALLKQCLVVENKEEQDTMNQYDYQAPVMDEQQSNKEEKIIDISEYTTRIENETQLLKKIQEEVEIAQQEADASDEKVNQLSVEISELEKKEADIEKRNSELDKQIVAAYEEQCRIQAINRKEQKSLLEGLIEKKKANDEKIAQFNSIKSDSEKRIMIGNESIARKEELLAAVLPQNNFSNVAVSDNIIQYPSTNDIIQMSDDSEEKVKRIA